MSAVPGVLNRTRQAVFLERLAREIEAASAAGDGFGVLLLKLRDFDELNLALGYAAVDALLADVAGRLEAGFSGQAACVRVGTKKFALVLDGVAAPALAMLAASKAERIVHDTPVPDGAHRARLDAALGIALYPEHAASAERLLQAAEAALDTALATDRVAVYDAESASEVRALQRAEAALVHALEHGGIDVCFQPQVDLATGAAVGAEALLRCRDADGAPVPPELVVQAAARARLLADMSRAVLNTALRYASEWPVDDCCVSFNVSPKSLKDADFTESIESTLGLWNRRPELVGIEITESAFMDDPETSMPIMRRLRDRGMRVSIDDFGTGYSSFAYFKNIPANELKVDKSFVQNMHGSDADRRIVQAVVALAHQFELEVVAEGVENRETLEVLRRLGCDIAQGFWIGRPMSPATFSDWLGRRG